MKSKLFTFIVATLLATGALAQTAAGQQSSCEVLISVVPGGNLAEMRKGTARIEPKSCDDFLKGELTFNQQKEYPNAPTMWLGGSTIKWGDAIFGRKLAVYTSKESGRQFNYNGRIEKNTQEEFLFTGKDNSLRIDAKFHIKRNAAGQITFALYEFDSQVSGVFRIGKE